MADRLLSDLRFALRTLRRTPAFGVAVIATIALGMGATASLFTVVDAILLRPLPFSESDRVYRICETNPAVAAFCVASPSNVADWARSSRTLESAGVARTESFIGRDDQGSYGVRGGIVSPGFLRVLRLQPLQGRLIEDRDMPHGANQVAMVSYAFWQGRLGGDPNVVGKPIILDGKPATVIGVLKADAYVPDPHLGQVEAWKPLTASVDDVERRAWRGFLALARLAPGASPEAMRSELETLRSQLAIAYPDSNRDWGVRTVPARELVVGDVRSRLWIFLGVAAVVLLIVCANVASLLLVRASGRSSEFAVRAALGAPRTRLVQQLITESVVLSLAGGAAGLLLASWATRVFVAVAPASIPRLDEVGVDGRVVLFALAISAITAAVFGSAPARQASRPDLNGVLKGTRTTTGGSERLRSALVVAEVALALVLLVGAGLLTRSFARLLQWDAGFDRTGIVTTWMLPPAGTSDRVALMHRVRDEVATLPGITEAGLVSAGPAQLFGGVETGTLAIEGRQPFPAGSVPTIEWFDTDSHYFRTLGVRLVRGRPFAETDTRGAAPVAVVNETFARRFFANGAAIGQRVTVQDYTAEIVGVVSDTRPLHPDEPTPPQIYWPIDQYRRGAAYLVFRAPHAAGLERAVKARVASVDPGVQLTPFLGLDDLFGKTVVSPRFNMLLVVAFAVVAVLLAAVGVYGVMAYAVASRRRELGIHVALGATPGRLVAGVVKRGMTLAAIGIALGIAAALASGRLLTSLLYGLPASDPATLAGAIGLFAAIALVACWLPARAASRTDPIAALRGE